MDSSVKDQSERDQIKTSKEGVAVKPRQGYLKIKCTVELGG